MPLRPPLIAVCTTPPLQEALQRIADERGLVIGNMGRYAQPGKKIDLAQLSEHEYCIAFIDLTQDVAAGFLTAETLALNTSPRVIPIAVSPVADASTIMQAMTAGCSQFIPWPATDKQIGDALTTLLNRIKPTEDDHTRDGRVVAFLGVRGGVGTTTLAIHTAKAAARDTSRQVLLIDMHRELGHVAVYLGKKNPGSSYIDLLRESHRLDAQLLNSFVMNHSTNLGVLCSDDDCSHLSDVVKGTGQIEGPSSLHVIDKVFSMLRKEYNLTVIDGDIREPDVVQAAQRADYVFFVASPEIASLRDIARYTQLVGKDEERHRILLTRTGLGPITPEMIVSNIGLPVVAAIGDFTKEVTDANNAGQLVAQNVRGFHAGIDAIVAHIDNKPVVAQIQAKKSLFGRWRQK